MICHTHQENPNSTQTNETHTTHHARHGASLVASTAVGNQQQQQSSSNRSTRHTAQSTHATDTHTHPRTYNTRTNTPRQTRRFACGLHGCRKSGATATSEPGTQQKSTHIISYPHTHTQHTTHHGRPRASHRGQTRRVISRLTAVGDTSHHISCDTYHTAVEILDNRFRIKTE